MAPIGGGLAMNVALTGATGFIGSHVLAELQKHGHEVTALVRDDSQVDIVATRGATSIVVDLYDRPAVVSALRTADGAVHTASPGDATSANLDEAVADAAIEAFAGTGKPYLQISGAWVYGNNLAISEASPMNAPALVAWRQPIERRVIDAADMRGVVIVSGVAYWKTTRLAAITSLAMERTQPLPNLPKRPQSQSALQEPSPAPTKRLARA